MGDMTGGSGPERRNCLTFGTSVLDEMKTMLRIATLGVRADFERVRQVADVLAAYSGHEEVRVFVGSMRRRLQESGAVVEELSVRADWAREACLAGVGEEELVMEDQLRRVSGSDL